MAILGMINTEKFASERFTNIRREVFYKYPNGAATITGILSMMDSERTNDPEFGWYEKRWKEARTETASQGGSVGPFRLGDDSATVGVTFTWTANTEYVIVVDSTERFRLHHVVLIPVDLNTAASTGNLRGIVTSVVSSTKLRVRATSTVALVDNDATNENVDKEVKVIGTAVQQGSLDNGQQIYDLPVFIQNYLQIQRSPFSFTKSAMQTSAKFDETGPYLDKSNDTSLQHSSEIELALLFGERSKYVDPTTDLPTYTTGGILWFLQQWELGNTGNGGAFAYRTGAAATADTDDNKRIITNASGVLNEKTYDSYLERAFRKGNPRVNEKLVICGSGALLTINQLYRSKSVLNTDLPSTDTYGMNVIKHVTPFGTIYYKTHPLFSENETMRYNMLFLDTGYMKLRHMTGRDTQLIKQIQPNGADYRRDEWFTEWGFEMQFPEACMYLQNVRDYAP